MKNVSEFISYQSLETVPYSTFENLMVNPEYAIYCKALISLSLRMCDPLDVIQLLNIETENDFEQVNLALQGVIKLSELFPCTVKEFSKFFTAADFTEEVQFCDSLPQSVTSDRCSSSFPREESINYSEKVRNKVFQALRSIELHIKDLCVTNIQESYELLAPIIRNDVETQVGLVMLTNSYMTVPLIKEIWKYDLNSKEQLIECAGTIAMAKIIEINPFILQELEEVCHVITLPLESISRNKNILENVHDIFESSPAHSEEVVFSNFDTVKKRITAVESYIKKNRDISVESIISTISGDIMTKFMPDTSQLPYITVARRISCPAAVEEAIIMECISGSICSSTLGIKILIEILISLPYEIENVSSYLLEKDFEEENIKKEKILVENISKVCSRMETPSEVVSLQKEIACKMESDMKDAIQSFVVSSETISQTQIESREFLGRFNILENIQAQACLLDLAERLTDSIIVKQILIMDMLENKTFTSHPGFLALKNVLDKWPVQTELVNTYLGESILDVEKIKRYFSVCQNISSCSQFLQERASI